MLFHSSWGVNRLADKVPFFVVLQPCRRFQSICRPSRFRHRIIVEDGRRRTNIPTASDNPAGIVRIFLDQNFLPLLLLQTPIPTTTTMTTIFWRARDCSRMILSCAPFDVGFGRHCERTMSWRPREPIRQLCQTLSAGWKKNSKRNEIGSARMPPRRQLISQIRDHDRFHHLEKYLRLQSRSVDRLGTNHNHPEIKWTRWCLTALGKADVLV